MYRKEIKVLDCTIRDGGLINNYQFGNDFVKAVYRAACDSGADCTTGVCTASLCSTTRGLSPD